MKKKSKKVWSIIGICALVLAVIAYIVLSIVFPDETPYYTNLVIDYICNKPLPVIGVSCLFLFVFIWRLVSFILKNRGKKFSELQGQINSLKQELATAKQDAENYKQAAYELYETCNEHIKEVCDAIPNRKVKAIGEKIYGKETNSKTETESI